MVEEAPLAQVESGLTPQSDGWFVVNARDAAWLVNKSFGARCVFEADTPVVRESGLDVHRFPQLGITLAVLEPGKPSGLYHRETTQEDFLVLTGECILLVEEEERRLRTWDFVHCPPGTAHVFVGSGKEPCVILMVGARTSDKQIVYPDSELARAATALAPKPRRAQPVTLTRRSGTGASADRISLGRDGSVDLRHHVLDLRVVLQAVKGQVLSVPRLLVAAVPQRTARTCPP